MSHLSSKIFHLFIPTGILFILLLPLGCNEVVGPVPEFVFEFDDFADLTLEEVDTSTIAAEEVAITEGTVTNAAAESFQTTTPATATAVAGAVSASVSSTQTTYWSGQSQGNILAQLDAGNTDILTQVTSITSTFSGNATLSDYLTSLTSPTSGRALARLSSSASRSGGTPGQPLARTTADLDDCRAAAQEAYDEAVATLNTALSASLATIETRYNSQLSIISNSAAAQRLTVNERHATRLADFLTFFNTIAARITTLSNDGSISAAQATTLNLFNLIIYAVNVNGSRTLRDSELTLVSNLETTNTSNLNTSRSNLIASVNTDYDTNLSAANAALSQTRGSCHNQGGSTGG